LADTGRPFDPAAIPEPDLTEGQVGGYGLFLDQQLMDKVTNQPRPDGNHWRLAKHW
jgi:serine/threonine-protein kinase RsbW